MANKTLKTRIKLKYDTLANWQGDGAEVVLLKGEVAICEVPTDSSLQQVTPPAILFKVGDGVKKFSELPWVSGLAADVYAWAKAAKKPTYTASEVGAAASSHTHASKDITDFTTAVNGLIDTKIAAIPSVDIPEYTLEAGTTEGSVVLKKDGVAVGDDVIINGYEALKNSIAAKYTKPEGGIPKTDLASAVQTSLGKADAALASADFDAFKETNTTAIADAKKAGTDASAALTSYKTTNDAAVKKNATDISNLQTSIKAGVSFKGKLDKLPAVDDYKNGDLIIVGSKEYILLETTVESKTTKTWIELGDEGSHLTKATADGYYEAKGTASTLIKELDGSITGTAGAGKTLTALSQTDGKITATFADISIKRSQISDLLKYGTVSALSITDISNLQTALDGKEAAGTAASLIADLDNADKAVNKQYVTAVVQTDGTISVTRKQISYNELADTPTIATPAAGKLLDASGTEIFNANQSTDDTIICIDCGSATELIYNLDNNI